MRAKVNQSTIGAVTRRAGPAAVLVLGLVAGPAPAQEAACDYGHWDADSGVNLAAGNPFDDGHIRYGGPCSLRVTLDDVQPGWVENSTQQNSATPLNESALNVRFYVNFDEVAGGSVVIFQAYDGSAQPAVSVQYQAAEDNLVIDVAGAASAIATDPLGEGWHSIGLAWEAAADAAMVYAIDGATDQVIGADTEGVSLTAARLGNVASNEGDGAIYFDDYDARRFTRPGRLLLGDADDTGDRGIGDVVDILSEVNELGLAPGQPDCNESGSVEVGDAVCLLTMLGD